MSEKVYLWNGIDKIECDLSHFLDLRKRLRLNSCNLKDFVYVINECGVFVEPKQFEGLHYIYVGSIYGMEVYLRYYGVK